MRLLRRLVARGSPPMAPGNLVPWKFLSGTRPESSARDALAIGPAFLEL